VGNHGFWDQRLALEWTRDNSLSLKATRCRSPYLVIRLVSLLQSFEYPSSFLVYQELTRYSISWPTT
jgi:hypothetical protein